MRERIIRQLDKFPWLYRFAAGVQENLKFWPLIENLFGTKAREAEWRRRTSNWQISYWNSREHSHRTALLEKFARFSPITSALEIGSNCGPNLYLLTDKYPNISATGIDINAKAIETGRELFASAGRQNVNLVVGGVDELGQFPDDSFDMVFTDAVLIYVGPDRIENTIREMVRIARKGLILAERHIVSPKDDRRTLLGIRHLGLWHRDYIKLLEKYTPRENIHIERMTKEIWADRGWHETGAFITAILG